MAVRGGERLWMIWRVEYDIFGDTPIAIGRRFTVRDFIAIQWVHWRRYSGELGFKFSGRALRRIAWF